MSTPKRIVIIAGPNGAGKITFARDFLPQEAHCPDFINADLIAARVGRGESFAFETPLAGVTHARSIRRWQAAGYHVKLLSLSLPSSEMAIMRVAARVAQGGHDVPENVIRRRFDADLHNFHQRYTLLANG